MPNAKIPGCHIIRGCHSNESEAASGVLHFTCLSSPIQTILSVPDSHRLSCFCRSRTLECPVLRFRARYPGLRITVGRESAHCRYCGSCCITLPRRIPYSFFLFPISLYAYRTYLSIPFFIRTRSLPESHVFRRHVPRSSGRLPLHRTFLRRPEFFPQHRIQNR